MFDQDRLVLENLKLVYFLAQRYTDLPCYDDLIQEGTIGLIKAARKFDPDRGNFASYARQCIVGEFLHYFRDKAGLIRNGARDGRIIKVASLNVPCTDEGYRELIDLIPNPELENTPDPRLDRLDDLMPLLSADLQIMIQMRLKGFHIKAIARQLGRPKSSVFAQMVKLISLLRSHAIDGCDLPVYIRWKSDWEPEALDYLLSNAGACPQSELVARFNRQAKLCGWAERSKGAIMVKLHRARRSDARSRIPNKNL
jgi:RNA polymerase sigma factor (sigma-70 family)